MGQHGWRGYVSSREIRGNLIPQRVQNLVIRTAVENRGWQYLLSATEYYMADCHMILKGAVEELPKLEGLAFYSLHQLPAASSERTLVYEACFAAGAGLFFSLEDLLIRTRSDTVLVEDLWLAKTLAPRQVASL